MTTSGIWTWLRRLSAAISLAGVLTGAGLAIAAAAGITVLYPKDHWQLQGQVDQQQNAAIDSLRQAQIFILDRMAPFVEGTSAGICQLTPPAQRESLRLPCARLLEGDRILSRGAR